MTTVTPPPTDHVARALLSRGAREHAMHLLRAAVARDPNERACAALLRAVEARPDASVSGPEVQLDLALVDAYVGRSMVVEAHAVLHGAGLEATPDGAARARWLNTVLVPPPPNADPALVEILHHVYTGGASLALTLLDERAARGEALPDWADEKRAHLRQLVLGLAQEQQDVAPEPARALPPISRDVAAKLSERDWPGARAVAERYVQESPDDASAKLLLEAISRILHALTHRQHDPSPSQLRTAPMTPRMTADLNIRMGNLEDGERLYRKIVLETTADPTARQMLDDIQLVRKHLDPRTAPRPRSVMSGARPTPAAGKRPTDAASAGTRPTEPLRVPVEEVEAQAIAAAPAPPLAPPAGVLPDPPRAGTGPARSFADAARELDAAPRALPDPPRASTGAPRSFVGTTPEPVDPRGARQPPLGMDAHQGIAEAPTPMAPLDREEVTRRVDSTEAARASARGSADSLSTAPLPPVPSSVLSKKSQPLPAGGYAPGTVPGPTEALWEEDGSTAVVRPEEEAELFLKQGRLDKALAIYEDLVRKKPWEARFSARLAEIQALVASGRAHVPAEQTVRRDVSDLRYLTAASTQSVPPDDEAPAPRVQVQEAPRPRPVSRVFAPPSAAAAAPAPAPARPPVLERPPVAEPKSSAGVTVTRIVRIG